MVEELLKKIPTEKCWAITAKILTTFALLRGEKRVATEMGTGEGIISPVLGAEKWQELTNKAWGEEGGRQIALWVKETFNIPVEDAIGAHNLIAVATVLSFGDEWDGEFVEKTPERVIWRVTECPWWNRWKEQELNHDVVSCYPVHEAWIESGLKAINPKIVYKFTKAMPRGDLYCENVYEFKEE